LTCVVCFCRYSSEEIRGLTKQWVECDGYSKQFHVDCIPKKHQKEFDLNYVDDEIDFICHLCITDDKDCMSNMEELRV